jgi:hypothetical protein
MNAAPEAHATSARTVDSKLNVYETFMKEHKDSLCHQRRNMKTKTEAEPEKKERNKRKGEACREREAGKQVRAYLPRRRRHTPTCHPWYIYHVMNLLWQHAVGVMWCATCVVKRPFNLGFHHYFKILPCRMKMLLSVGTCY